MNRLDRYYSSVKKRCLKGVLFLAMIGGSLEGSFTQAATTPIAEWSFSGDGIEWVGEKIQVKDNSQNAYIGTCENGAKIMTIGNSSQKYNVLYFGEGEPYFDMGTKIGEAIYGLSDYTISIYYYQRDATTAYGQWLYGFSNSDNIGSNPIGCMFFEPLRGYHAICSTNYDTETGLRMGVIPNGSWHHICFIQSGNTGSLYLDGVLKGSGIVNTPANTLKRSDRSGTLYNYIGKPCYSGDSYLQNAYLYQFKLYNKALSSAELTAENINATITALNTALAQNKDYAGDILKEESSQWSIGDIDAITDNISLPQKGSLYPDIKIQWSSSHPQLIDTDGQVNRPDYVDFKVTLTATFLYEGSKISKDFIATIKASKTLSFENGLMVHYDFSKIEGNEVKDISNSQLCGRLMNDAQIIELPLLGDTIQVLQLGQDSAYFDMGQDLGAFIPSINDYTIGCYYYIDTAYSYLNWNGNALWNISNSGNVDVNEDAYMACFLNNQGYYISPSYWAEEQAIYTGKPANMGKWHHIAYTQKNNTGTLYVDGLPAKTSIIDMLPSKCMIKAGVTGTSCHWIGRSCYAGDAYLRQSMVYDFRMYNKALTSEEIEKTEIAVANTLKTLNKVPLSGLEEIITAQPNIYRTSNGFCLFALRAGDQIRLISSNGQTMQQSIAASDRQTIDMSRCNNGLYLFQIVRGKQSFTHKVIW